MSHFHPFRVTEVRRETPDTVSVLLTPQGNAEMHYKAGQYLNFRINHQGEELRRAYSLCSAPSENEFRIAVKQIEGGRASVFFNTLLKAGDTLEAMKPEGNFTCTLDPSHAKHYVFYAAGSGITPVYSLIKEVLYQEPNSRCTLFYGNRSAGSIIFGNELDQLSAANARFKVYHILSDGSTDLPLFNGRITFGKAAELLYNFCQDEMPKEYFVCGPSGMMTSVINALEDSGVDNSNIHSEFFTNPGEDAAPKAKTEEPAGVSHFDGKARVKVILDDEEFEFELASKGMSLLNAALEEGADAPYSCKGGVCTTCRAKLLQGKVRMDSNFALTDGEMKAGFILTCQSHPDSAEIVVSYDE